jgi:hypothetical protein
MLNEKFTEVKTLILSDNLTQAQDECDNGVNACAELVIEFGRIKTKLIDKFGEDELFSDFQNVIETI